jgi:hypothetical protein
MIREGELLGVLSEVGFGLRDMNEPALWATCRFDDNVSVLLVWRDYQEIRKILVAYQIYDVSGLNGKAVWVNVHQNTATYSRPFEPQAPGMKYL